MDLGHQALLSRFSKSVHILEQGLALTVAQITADIKDDNQGLVNRVEEVENYKLLLPEHMQHIQDLQDHGIL